MPNAGLFNWANNRSDRLAAAGSPGTVRVVDSRREIRLCRKISGNAKPQIPRHWVFFSNFSAVRVVRLLLRCSSTSPTPSLSKAGRWRPSSLQSSVAPSWAGSRALWGRRATVWRRRWEIHKPDAVVTFKCQMYLFYFKQRKQKQTKKQKTAMVLMFEKG